MTGPQFAQARQRAGFTQPALAAVLGVDLRTVQRWEATRGPVRAVAVLALEAVEARLARHA